MEHGLLYVLDQKCLALGIGQELLGQRTAEGAHLCQSGQMHPGRHSVLGGRGQQLVVTQRDQTAFGCDAVGEGGQMGQIGQLLLQHDLGDEGVGIAVHRQGAPVFLLERDHQLLSRLQGGLTQQKVVVPQQGLDRGAVAPGDAEEGFAGGHGVGLGGEEHHQRLAYRQLSGLRQLILLL